MQGKTQQKELLDHFSRQINVTHGTFSTAATLPGPVDIFQIQLDNETGASPVDFQIFRDGDQIKAGGYAAGQATREITWLGRELRFDEFLVLQKTNDVSTTHWTVIYRDGVS